MFKYPMLLVRDRSGNHEERLNINDAQDTFQDAWVLNQSMEISFTARLLPQYEQAFNLLQVQNYVIYGGQRYVIQQAVPAIDNGILTNQVKAVHVMYEALKNIRKEDINAGTLTYTFQSACNAFVADNDQGVQIDFTGDFQKVQIENLGNSSFLDFLTSYLDKFGAAMIPDNLMIHFCSRDTFRHDTGNMFVYGGNTDAVHLSFDSTSLINQCWCYGKPVDTDNSDSSNDATKGKYLVKFIWNNQSSIQKYGLQRGAPVSDERFTDQASMQSYMDGNMQTEPTIQLTMQYLSRTNIARGDGWFLRVPSMGLEREVTITGITQNPYNPATLPTITLDNTAAALKSISLTLNNRVNKHDKSLTDLKAVANGLRNAENHFVGLRTIDGGVSSVSYQPDA